MDILRRITVGIACGLLPVVLFSFGLSFSLTRVLGTPDSIKHALAESRVYDNLAPGLLDQAQKEADKNAQTAPSNDSVPVQQAEVRAAIERAFPGQSLQPHIEQALDGVYAWLRGDTEQLSFSVNIEQNKANLLTNLTEVAKQRVASLPECPPGTPLPADFDALQATCKPPGLTPDIAAQQTQAKLNQSDFFKELSLNSDAMKADDGQTLTDKLKQVPDIYDGVVKATYIAGGVALACLAATVFLSQTWRAGLRRAAKILLSTGVLSVFSAWLSVFLVGKLIDMFLKSDASSTQLQGSLTDAIRTLASDIRAWWFGYGILLIVLAVAAFLVLKLLKEKDIIEKQNSTPPEQRPRVVIN